VTRALAVTTLFGGRVALCCGAMSRPQLARAWWLAAAASILACRHPGSARLEGHWRGLRAEGVPSDTQAAANAFANGTELDVRGDAITVSTPKERQSGRYSVVREDKTVLVITTDKDGADQPQTFTFVDAKTMKWAVLDGKSIVFVKQ
jgi:hypothetical protein